MNQSKPHRFCYRCRTSSYYRSCFYEARYSSGTRRQCKYKHQLLFLILDAGLAISLHQITKLWDRWQREDDDDDGVKSSTILAVVVMAEYNWQYGIDWLQIQSMRRWENTHQSAKRAQILPQEDWILEQQEEEIDTMQMLWIEWVFHDATMKREIYIKIDSWSYEPLEKRVWMMEQLIN